MSLLLLIMPSKFQVGGTSTVRLLRLNLCVLILILGVLGVALGQDSNETSSIKGTVYDASGAVIANARVTATNEDGANQSADTDAEGNYLLAGLDAGTYSVSITADGFKPFQKDDFDLHDGDDERLDANLDPDTDSDSDKDSTPAVGQQTIHLTWTLLSDCF
jgi:hypothetical protein